MSFFIGSTFSVTEITDEHQNKARGNIFARTTHNFADLLYLVEQGCFASEKVSRRTDEI